MEVKGKVKVKVEIPYLMRGFTKGVEVVEMTAGTLAECLRKLESKFPELKGWFIDSEGELPLFANIYVNGDDVRWAQGLETPLKNGDRITMVPFFPGG